MRSQLGAAPAIERLAIEQDLSGDIWPDPHQHARQRRLARPRRTQHHGDRAWTGLQAHLLQDRLCPARCARHHIAYHHLTGRRHATERGVALGVGPEQCFQTQEGAARADKTAPGIDHLIDRRQGTRHQHVGSDHAAGGEFAFDHQQRAGGQCQRLLAVAHPLADCGDAVGKPLCLALAVHVLGMAAAPALAQAGQHAHRLDYLSITHLALQVEVDVERCLGSRFGRGDGAAVAEPGKRRLHQREADRDPAQKGVQEEQHSDVDRCPGRIEECEDAIAGEELAHLGEIIECTLRGGARLAEVGLEAGVEDPGAEHRIEAYASAHQQARARPLGERHHREEEKRDQRHHQQGELAAADQHAVVDLQHVERGGEHQHVGHHAEDAHDEEFTPESVEGGGEFAAPEEAGGCHVGFDRFVCEGAFSVRLPSRAPVQRPVRPGAAGRPAPPG